MAKDPNKPEHMLIRRLSALTAIAALALCSTSGATAFPIPQREETAIVYGADPLTGICTNRAHYYVRGSRVFAADAATGAPTSKVVRYFVDDRVIDAEYTGAKTHTILRYIIGDRVYAADVRGAQTNKILSYLVGDKVYAADDVTGAQTRTPVRCIIGTAKTD